MCSFGVEFVNQAGNVADTRCIPNDFSGGFEIQFPQSRHLHQNG